MLSVSSKERKSDLGSMDPPPNRGKDVQENCKLTLKGRDGWGGRGRKRKAREPGGEVKSLKCNHGREKLGGWKGSWYSCRRRGIWAAKGVMRKSTYSKVFRSK